MPHGHDPRLPMLAAVALLLCTACRPGGEAEPATSANPPRAEAEAPTSPPSAETVADAPGNDETSLAATASPDPEPAIETPQEPESPKQVIPDEAYKVLILGDSLAATGFGALLERRLDAHPHITCFRKGKSASGLARPDFFDWVAEGKRQADDREPDLVVVIMGGNDGQDLTRLGAGKRIPWQHEDWADSYRERMDTFLREIGAPERKVLWLGLPFMGLKSLEKKLVTIRQVQMDAVEALGEDATYLDTVPLVTDEAGEMLTSAKVGDKSKPQTLRADDKIHFTMPGSEYFADRIYPSVLQILDLPDIADLPEPEPAPAQPAPAAD